MRPVISSIPDPDPGELFTDISTQIHGWTKDGTIDPAASPMSGFVDDYMRQKPTTPALDPYAIMHYFTPGSRAGDQPVGARPAS
jgi:hypothetical protein